MFKFRRSSLCNNTDVISSPTSSSSSEDEDILNNEGVLKDSDSRLILQQNQEDEGDEKESLSEPSTTESPTTSTATTSRSSAIEALFPTCKLKSTGQQQSQLEREGEETIVNDILLLNTTPTATTTSTTNSCPKAMLDRKRKERHESTSHQDQETKVIRGEQSGGEQSIDLVEGRKPEKFIQPYNQTSSSKNEILPENLSSGNGGQQETLSTSGMDGNNGEISHKPPDIYGHEVRTMPQNFEAEKQRQWERTAAQWTSRKIRKPHRSRHGKSSKSFSEVENIVNATKYAEDHKFENLRISSGSGPKFLQNPTMSLPIASLSAGEDEQDENEDEELGVDAALSFDHPSLDFSTLHHHVDSQEPLTCRAAHYSSDQAMLSPRNSIIRDDAMGIPPSPPQHQIPVDPRISRQILDGNQDSKINSLARQISNLKRQLKLLEEEYEMLMGYRPSHADKLNNKEMKKHLLLLSKLKKELRQIKEDPASLKGNGTALLDIGKNANVVGVDREKHLEDLKAAVKKAESSLQEVRMIAVRPEDLLRMTHSELHREKAAMQKELIVLERRFGRPESKEEKDIVRNLYDRYRSLKKLSGKISFTTTKANSIDLVPILEHETLDLPSESDIPKITIEVKKDQSPKSRRRRNIPGLSIDGNLDLDADESLRNEDYNDMATGELELKLKMAADEKRKLRMSLRRFEVDFQSQTGRLPQKEDKYGSGEMEQVYQKYKHIRGIVRLLDVLIHKRKFPHLLVDLTKIEVED